jgi:hypothetical protein
VQEAAHADTVFGFGYTDPAAQKAKPKRLGEERRRWDSNPLLGLHRLLTSMSIHFVLKRTDNCPLRSLIISCCLSVLLSDLIKEM